MKKWNKCRSCGCFLDPGEGSVCDECRAAKPEKGHPPAITHHRLMLKPGRKE